MKDSEIAIIIALCVLILWVIFMWLVSTNYFKVKHDLEIINITKLGEIDYFYINCTKISEGRFNRTSKNITIYTRGVYNQYISECEYDFTLFKGERNLEFTIEGDSDLKPITVANSINRWYESDVLNINKYKNLS